MCVFISDHGIMLQEAIALCIAMDTLGMLTPSLTLSIAKWSHLRNLLDDTKCLDVVFICIHLTVGELHKQMLHVC